MNINHVIIAGILCAIGVSECLECFNCLNIADPQTCTSTVQCSEWESCSSETLHSGNEVLLNMGCRNRQFCSHPPPLIIGRSIQTSQHYSCQHGHECCDTDSCNAQLCAHEKLRSCFDDETLDCARLNSIFEVCADVHLAKTTCLKFCGLCHLGHAVAVFSALNTYEPNVLANTVNAFPTVIFNEGNAYNPSTGHFTAPVDGIYHFTAQFCVNSHNGNDFYITKGYEIIAASRPYDYNYNGLWCSSGSCTVKLTRNEYVMHDGEPYANYTPAPMWAGAWSSFTGMLIQEL